MIIKKLKLKILTILILAIISFNNSYAAINLQDLSIVVASCDKYSGLWNPFFSLLFKYWPSLIDPSKQYHIPIFLIANKKTFNNPRVQHVLFPNEISWSDNMLGALSLVKTKYVLYLQEDYFLTSQVNEELLSKMLQYMQDQQAAYLEISAFNKEVQQIKLSNLSSGINNLHEFAKHSPYRTSLQAGIWDKEALQWLIKPGETAVDFELASSKRSEGMQKLFLAHTDPNLDPVKYINAVIGGLLLQSAIDHLRAEQIAFDPKLQPLPVDQDCKLIMLKRKLFSIIKNKHTRLIFDKCKFYLKKIIYP